MKSVRYYNIYIFAITFIRNIIDVYSVVYLYQMGIDVKSIIFIYTLVYYLGIFISYLSIYFGNLIGYKYILALSLVFTVITFYIINGGYNIYLISLFISLSMFTYYPIKHYYGFKLLRNKKDVGNTLLCTYIASILSSYIAIINVNMLYIIIMAMVGIIFILFIKKDKYIKIVYPKKISKYKLNFFIFDQFKVIFILLEPLYLYIVANNLYYVGIFNIVLGLSSLLCLYFIIRKVNISKYYKYINIIFTLVLFLKLNISNRYILLIIAILEGIGIKSSELVSVMNLYNYDEINGGYIIFSEWIFCLARVIILGIIYFLSIHLKVILYILLFGIFCLTFQYKKDT